MMERPEPTYEPAYQPTYERDYGAEHRDPAPADVTRRPEVSRDRDEIESIRPAEERDEDVGSDYGSVGDAGLGQGV